MNAGKPLLNGFLIIAVRIIITDLYTLQFGINKCLLCQHVNLGRTETETQEIVEEEIMQTLLLHRFRSPVLQESECLLLIVALALLEFHFLPGLFVSGSQHGSNLSEVSFPFSIGSSDNKG